MSVKIKKMSEEKLQKTNHYSSSYSEGDWVFINTNDDWTNSVGYFYNKKTGARIDKKAKTTFSSGPGLDGIRSNNPLRKGNSSKEQKKLNEMFLYHLNTGKDFESFEEVQGLGFNLKNKDVYENFIKDIKAMKSYHGLETASKDFSFGLYSGKGGINEENFKIWLNDYEDIENSNMSDEEKEEAKRNLSKEIAESNVSKVGPYNPYVNYMEQMQSETYQNELGLLQQQNLAQQQQAEIASQQMMMQNAQFKDQLLEQIKTERMAKLRSGMSQMQIANEEMQFMVGNQMQNQQAVSQANQQLLGAKQQEGMIPYQAWLNASQGVTGGQGYANFAAGMAATDASSLQMQAMQMMQQDPSLTYNKAIERLQTNTNISKN